MARDGNGNYNPPLNSWNPAIEGNEAQADHWNQTLTDISEAITQSVANDGQTAMVGNLKMGTNKVTGLGAATANNDAMRRMAFMKGADLVAASTLSIPNEGSVFRVTGTTTINSLSGSYDGRVVFLYFANALTIQHSTELHLPNGENMNVPANTTLVFFRESSQKWVCLYGSAATRNVGTSNGQLMEVGTRGWGGLSANLGHDTVSGGGFGSWPNTTTSGLTYATYLHFPYVINSFAGQIAFDEVGVDRLILKARKKVNGVWLGWEEIYHSGNLPTTASRWPTWGEVTGKPSSFTPSSHTHPWSQVTGAPATATRWPTFAEVTGKPTNYATTWESVAAKPAQATRWPSWSEVTSKPTTFAPSAHNHSWSNITSGVPVTATRWPTWSEVTGKPSTFTPPTGAGGVGTYAHVRSGNGVGILNWNTTISGGSIALKNGSSLSGTWRILSGSISVGAEGYGLAVRIS